MSREPTYHQLELRIQELEKAQLEQKVVETSLRERIERYQTIIESIGDGYYEVDIAGNFTFVNDSMCSILKYTRDELIGLNNRHCMDEENARKVFKTFNRVYRTEKAHKAFDWELLRKDGSKCDVEVSVALRKDPEGQPIGYLGIARDITERKKADMALHESEKKYRLLIENQTDLLVEVDREGRFLFVSPSYCKIFGKTETELLGKTFMPLVHEEDRESTAKAMENLYRAPYTAYMEQRAMTKDGWRWLGWMDTATLDINGEVATIIGVGRDITERRQVEEALRESEAFLEQVFEAIQDGISVLDVELNVIKTNTWMEQMYASRKPLVSCKCFQVYQDRASPCPWCPALKTMEDGRGHTEVVPYPTLEDPKGWIELSTFPIKDKDGNVMRIIEYVKDITERKQAENELLGEKHFSEALINQLPGSFYMFPENGRMLRWNHNLEKVTGYTSEEIQRMNALDFFEEDEKDLVSLRIQEVFATGVSQVEANFITKTGEKIPHILTGARVDYGGVAYLLGVGLDITDSKQIESAYRESEARFRQIAENIKEVFWLFDWQQQRVLYTSPAYDEIWGKSRESLYECYEDWGESIHPDDVPHAVETFNRILETGGGEPREYRIVRPDGSVRWISDTGYAIKDEDGNVVRITGIAEDITDRKQAESALKDNIHFLESLETVNRAISSSNNLDEMLNQVIEAVFKLYDCDRAWLLYPCDPGSPSFKVPIESTRPEYPGGKERSLTIPMTRPMAYDMKAALAAEGPLTFGPGNEHPISSEIHINFSVQSQMIVSVRPKTGNAWLFGVHQCAYPRVWTENEQRLFNEIGRRIADGLSSLLFFRELTRSEEKYRLLADNISDNLWILDIQTLTFSYVSPTVKGITGYSADEVTGVQLDHVMTPASLDLAARVLEGELAADKDGADPSRYRTLEMEQYHKDGSTIWTEVSVQFIYDDEGHPVSILGVTRDISDRKRLQNQLQKAQKMESLGLMASGIAHDLNNILSGIVSYPDLLLMDLPEDSPLFKPLETIKESGNRAAEVVSDLLTVVRGAAVTMETSNLNSIISEYLASPEQKKLERLHPSVSLETDFAPDLLNIKCSSIHVKKSVMNLVINAYESFEGEGRVTLSTQNLYLDKPIMDSPELKAGEYIRLTVADDGPGISAEDLERIFEPFYTKKVMGRSGTGLGLAVVWNMIQEHNGTINVKSGDQGTDFELYFPASRETLDKSDDTPSLQDHSGQGEKILVIDDEKRQREIACALLTKLN